MRIHYRAERKRHTGVGHRSIEELPTRFHESFLFQRHPAPANIKQVAACGLLRVGDTGSEQSPETRGLRTISGLSEAECEAIATDATLCELVLLWSTLDTSIRQAIVAIARSSSRAQ
jgi:hypothetical protein